MLARKTTADASRRAFSFTKLLPVPQALHLRNHKIKLTKTSLLIIRLRRKTQIISVSGTQKKERPKNSRSFLRYFLILQLLLVGCGHAFRARYRRGSVIGNLYGARYSDLNVSGIGIVDFHLDITQHCG